MKIHILSHTHWDREWYKPFQYFKVKLSYFFDKLIDNMENNAEYKHFMLDGQMVMIEDYLNLKPRNKQRIKKLVEQGKLIIGPWYTQPDEFAPDGESLIRNLLIGTNMAEEYGECMMVGYLPDSFGQSCQMPHILKGCNIESACAMRGIPAHKLKKTEFIWRGLNGDEVLTVALPKGYSNAMFLPKANELIDMRVGKIIQDLQKIGNKENFLLMNGVDHQFHQSQTAEYINYKKESKDEYIHSTLEKYIEDTHERDDELVRIDGELISPVTNRVHTSIASTRMYQKTENRQLQTLLEKGVEPLCTMSWKLGAEYPQEIINSAWKEMLKNQSHDSIGGCCSDEVHREIGQRFADVQTMGETLKKMHSRAIAAVAAGDSPALVVFNDSMVVGKQMVNATIYCESDVFALIDAQNKEMDYTIEATEKIDAAGSSIWSLYLETPCIVNKVDISFEIDFDFNYGYKRLLITEGQQPKNNTGYKELDVRKIENSFSIITINNDGTFNLLDKQSQRMYVNLNTIEDCGDAGDTYNYSPVENDRIITNASVVDCDIKVLEYFNKKVALLSYEMKVPKELAADDKTRSSVLASQKIDVEITLYESTERVDIKTKIENIATDHRVRAIFPTPIKSDYSYAETQFGTIKRDNVIRDAQLWKENKWAEKPLPIYSNQKFVDVNDGEYGLAVLNRGLTEYEIYDHNGAAIATTLLRGVGFMGKPDLAIRPGRPSGVNIATPDAQCLGERVLEYSILAHIGDVDTARIAKQAAIYNAAPTAAQSEIKLTAIAKEHGQLIKLFDIERLQDCAQEKLVKAEQSDYSFIKMSNNELIISALKKAEKDEGIIIRIYNPASKIVKSADFTISGEIQMVYECDFIERNIGEIAHDKSTFSIKNIKGFTAQTYKIMM